MTLALAPLDDDEPGDDLLKQLGDLHPAAQGQSVGRSRRNIRSIFINYLRIQVLFDKRSRY